jgi:hypothetical protein
MGEFSGSDFPGNARKQTRRGWRHEIGADSLYFAMVLQREQQPVDPRFGIHISLRRPLSSDRGMFYDKYLFLLNFIQCCIAATGVVFM